MTVLAPESVEEACALLARDPELVPMAGGTDLLVHWPQNLAAHGRSYLDLSRLEEMKPHRWTDDALVLGGLTTYWDVLRDERARRELPLLNDAGRQVGAVQIQARGTWAGNIVNASPAADGVPVLMAYDAEVELVSSSGTEPELSVETVALSDFYLGYKKMRRRADQLIRSIRLPLRAYDVQVFHKVGARRAQAIAKVGLAITRSAAGWRVVAASMAPTVCRCRAIERMLEDGVAIGSPEDFLAAIREDVTPIDDIRSTARYRERVMARVLFYTLRGI